MTDPQKDAQSTSTPQVTPLDVLQNELGAFGMYQIFILILMGSSKFPLAYNQLAMIFYSPATIFICGSTGVKNDCPCADPEYNRSIFPRTLITDYNLICDREWLKDFVQMWFQFGTLTGSITFGMLSDRFGRKLSMWGAILVQIAAGFAAALSNSYWLFTVMRFFGGFASGGVIVISFVVMMEYTGSECRENVSLIFMTPFVLGTITLSLVAYIWRNYKHFLYAIGVVNCFQLVYICLMPETPRWYLTKQEKEKATKLFETVAKWNKKTEVDVKLRIEEHIASISGHTQKMGTLADVFRSKTLRIFLLSMAFDWLTCSFCYYGLSQFMGHLGGSVFTNSTASGMITLLGLLIGIPITKRFGRKSIVMVCNVLAAACLFLTLIVPEGVPVVVFASIGTSANFYVFAVVFLYCVELFPTVVRNAGMGFCSMSARIGSMAAPYVVTLSSVSPVLPKIIFGTLPLFASVITYLFLPETKGLGLTSTLEEGERLGAKKKKRTAPNNDQPSMKK